MIKFNDTEFELSAGNFEQLPASTLPEIVFSGKSNVGKSSLINKLVNRKLLARISSKPGKTATINFYKLKDLRLVDMPGYGYAKVSFNDKKRWAALAEGYFNSNRGISLVIQIVDMRHTPSSNDIEMIDFLYEKSLPFIIIATKSDKLNKTQRLERESMLKVELGKYKGIRTIPFSSSNGEGLDVLKEIICEYLNR